MREYTLDGHTVGYHRPILCGYDWRATEALESGIQTGAVHIIDDYPLPVIVIDRVTSNVEQNLAGNISIDGSRLHRDTACIRIDAAPREGINNTLRRWEVSVSYDDTYRNGCGNGRTLYSREFEGNPSREDVRAAIDAAAALLETFDYTSTWDLDTQRAEEFRVLLGGFPERPTRAEYEEKCALHGLTPEPDDERSYAASYYDYGVGGFAKLEPIRQLETEIYLRRMRVCVHERAKREATAADAPSQAILTSRPVLMCKRCSNSGHRGSYPFSTLPDSGLCDDCV